MKSERKSVAATPLIRLATTSSGTIIPVKLIIAPHPPRTAMSRRRGRGRRKTYGTTLKGNIEGASSAMLDESAVQCSRCMLPPVKGGRQMPKRPVEILASVADRLGLSAAMRDAGEFLVTSPIDGSRLAALHGTTAAELDGAVTRAETAWRQ